MNANLEGATVVVPEASAEPVPEIRWGAVPDDLPWRDGLFAWGPGEQQIVRDYVQRQGSTVWEWACVRAHDRWLELSALGGDAEVDRSRLIYESCLDVACWQQQREPRRVIVTLRDLDRGWREVQRAAAKKVAHEGTKARRR